MQRYHRQWHRWMWVFASVLILGSLIAAISLRKPPVLLESAPEGLAVPSGS